MKNKKVAGLLGLLLCLSLAFGALNFSAFSMDASPEEAVAQDNFGQFVSSADRSRLAEIELEPKVYSNATLEQEFDASTVLVVMDKNVSRINRVFDASFFGADFAIAGIEDLSLVLNEDLLTANDYRAAPSANSWAADYVSTNNAKGTVECQCYNCTTESKATDELPKNWNIDRASFRQILQITLPTDSKENVLRAIAKLEQIDGVKSAEPNYFLYSSKTPNDPQYGSLWAPNKINAPTAWDTTTGTYDVKVAVLDSGIDNHIDLITSVCRLSGYDFVNLINIDSTDPCGHGTHVAGTIGAIGNNSIGVTGVAWRVTLVPVRVLNGLGMGTASAIASGINHATNKGIHIINASFGSNSYTSAHYQAISNFPGLFVAAAGNDGTNNDTTPTYPANYSLSNVISVGASTAADSRASFSNYGKTSVHVFAPGDNIFSTVPILAWAIMDPSGYGYASGTSMAAPQVAGAAALMVSKNPNLTPSQVRTYIINNVDKPSTFSSICISGGRLNVQKALAAVPTPSSGC